MLGAELLDHVGDGGLFGGLLVDFAGLLLTGGDLSELGFQLATAILEPAGDLGQQVVAVLDPGADISGAVLEFALALKVEGVEQHLGDGLRILLREEPLGELARGFPDWSAIPANPQQQGVGPRP